MQFLGIDFAPLIIPMERRFQTLAVVALIAVQIGGFIIAPLVCYFLIFYTELSWLCLGYIFWTLFIDENSSKEGNRRSDWVRNWTWWIYAKNFFPVKLVKLPWGDLDPERNYLFCYFPHGILATGAFLGLNTNAAGFPEKFPNHKIHLHAISLFFKIPFLRELALSLGSLDVSKKAISTMLGKEGGGHASTIVVGGAIEAYYAKPGVHKIVLKKRKGFVRLALEYGTPLVPVYGFGETNLYSQVEIKEGSAMHRLREIVKKIFGFSVVVPVGRGVFQYTLGILPQRRPLTVVVGEPLDVPKRTNPTHEEIDDIHQKFSEKLVQLFEEQKKYYIDNYESAHLEIC